MYVWTEPEKCRSQYYPCIRTGNKSGNYRLIWRRAKDFSNFWKRRCTSYEEGLLELYKKIRPGEPLTVDSAESLITAMFFDPRRYDLAKVGRYKFNKKLAFKNRINGHVLAEDVVDVTTGEIIAKKEQS